MSDNSTKDFGLPDDDEILEVEKGIPGWFNVLFIGSVFIGLVYGLNFHFISNNSQAKFYKQDVKLHNKLYTTIAAELTEKGNNPFRGDSEAIARGEVEFKNGICASCHNANGTGSGMVGPNLMDTKWLHGNSEQIVYNIIAKGVGANQVKQEQGVGGKGGAMPGQKDALGNKKILQIMAWLAAKNPSLKPTAQE